MKCPNDQTEMEQGILANHGSLWIGKGIRSAMVQWALGGKKVRAYRCAKCGKIELSSEIESEKEEKE